MVRVFYTPDNCVDTIIDIYDVRADKEECTMEMENYLYQLAEYITTSFGTHHDGNGYTTYLEYIEFFDYDDFKKCLNTFERHNTVTEAFKCINRFAIGIIEIAD
jgi:hypothetical protein